MAQQWTKQAAPHPALLQVISYQCWVLPDRGEVITYCRADCLGSVDVNMKPALHAIENVSRELVVWMVCKSKPQGLGNQWCCWDKASGAVASSDN
jgi:hypothetical protein